jgi:cobalt-zinc-cadmium efflux system protein
LEHHGHHHHHDHHHHLPKSANNAFIIGIILNLLFVIIEAFYGFYNDSLALLSDAGHNLSDVISLALALLGFRLSKIKATQRFTYGFQKTTILVALANALLLLVAIGGIGIEATHRLLEKTEAPEGNIIAIVAGIGIIINGVSAMLFFRDKDKDLNIKGAYLHLAFDALISAAVVISGITMYYTGWFWMDSAISYIIVIFIFLSTWNLLKDSLRLSLDAVPRDIDLNHVKEIILKVKGVKDIHHIHIWAMSTTQNALTAHIVLDDLTDPVSVKATIKHELEHLNIHHATLETESMKDACNEAHECK